MSSWKMPAFLSTWIEGLTNRIDRRLREVFPLVFCGLLFTRERRRTCTSWFRAGGIDREFRRGYRAVCLTGRNTKAMGLSILYDIADSAAATSSERIKLTLDDTLRNAMVRRWKARACITTRRRVRAISRSSTVTCL
jgi:hypothetical protein